MTLRLAQLLAIALSGAIAWGCAKQTSRPSASLPPEYEEPTAPTPAKGALPSDAGASTD